MRFLWKNFPYILIGLAVAAFLVLFVLAKESPTEAGNRFLVALAKGDVDKLMDTCYFEGSKDDLRKQWEFAVKEAGPYYRFKWRVKDEKQSTPDTASIQLGWTKNALSPGSYEENTELPMVRDHGAWKVDIRALDHEIYPALPR